MTWVTEHHRGAALAFSDHGQTSRAIWVCNRVSSAGDGRRGRDPRTAAFRAVSRPVGMAAPRLHRRLAGDRVRPARPDPDPPFRGPRVRAFAGG